MDYAVNIEINSLRTYVDNSEEQLLSEVRREGIIEQGKEKNEIQMEHENDYRNKALHGRYFVAADDVRGSKSWEWLRPSGLKKETEVMIMAAQELALRTRNIRKVIDKEKISGMCRMCVGRAKRLWLTLSLNVKSWRRTNIRIGDMTKWKPLYTANCVKSMELW